MKRSPLACGLFPVLCAAQALLLAGCNIRYRSPEATFQAAKTASQNNDVKGIVACMTPESADAMAGMMVRFGSAVIEYQTALDAADPATGLRRIVAKRLLLHAAGGPEQAENLKQCGVQIERVFKRHGVVPDTSPWPDSTPTAADLAKLAAGINDKPQFLADMFAALKEYRDGCEIACGRYSSANLAEVKVVGNRARAKIDVRNTQEPLDFKYVDGAWKIDVSPWKNVVPKKLADTVTSDPFQSFLSQRQTATGEEEG